MKHDLETLTYHAERFNLDTTPEKLSHAFKVAKTFQEYHRPASSEFKFLEKFKGSLIKELKAQRKGPSIEELDALAAEANSHPQPDITARDEGVED